MKMGVGFFVFNRATTVRECTSRWMYLTEPRPSGSAHRDACIQQSHDRKGVHIEMHVFNIVAVHSLTVVALLRSWFCYSSYTSSTIRCSIALNRQ